ncbi:MAG: SpoIIE family protein phosphatase [Planctomycetes bacterium]|nr:SpoIIE family protein phosphatase [Planctomycetota bacterium]
MATSPNLPTGGKPGSTGAAKRLMTPPPAGERKSTGAHPAHRTSAGAMPVVQAPPPAGTVAPPPAAGKGAAPGQGTKPMAPRARQRTQGMPIKTKIVLSMSVLAGGTSLLLFVIVMMISTSSLDSTIVQSGVGMLQQAEAIHRPYRAGLNEKGLIAYFSQPKNRADKFNAWWKDQQKPWFHARSPACGEFANWEQLKDDRLWVKLAGEVLDVPTTQALTDAQRVEILGELGRELRNLQEKQSMPEAPTPRRVNDAAAERYKASFERLFRTYRLDVSANSFADLKAAIRRETEDKLINANPGGMRQKIFNEFRSEFVKDLNALTGGEGSQVRRIIFNVKDAPLPGFSPEAMTVFSPDAAELGVQSSNSTQVIGKATVDKGALVDNKAAYAFSTTDAESGDEITIYLDRAEIESRKSSLLLYIALVSVVAIALSLGLAFMIGGGITRPLQTLMNDIQVISGGNFSHRPQARSSDEIGIVAKLLGDMAAGLKAAQDVWLENQGRKHDLDIAKEIQENLLPKHVPRIAGYDVSAYYSPSKEVGGDYYDFFLVDKTHLGMVCADVSGKGIPGSMVMMMAKALVSYEAQETLSPRDIFVKVNRSLAKDIKRGMFVTAFYMLLDIPTARLTVASAGHNPLLLYRAATKQCSQINPGGIALGFDKDGRLFERNMKEEVIQLQRGDRAVIYTDGVTEAMSPSNEEFGEERLMGITVQCAGKTSTEYLTMLVNAIQSHAQKDEQHDDITIVTVKVG